MTEILTKIVIDCSTGEQTEVELTAEEITAHEAQVEAFAAAEAERLAAEEAVAAKKATVLAAIAEATGLTAEDIAEALA